MHHMPAGEEWSSVGALSNIMQTRQNKTNSGSYECSWKTCYLNYSKELYISSITAESWW